MNLNLNMKQVRERITVVPKAVSNESNRNIIINVPTNGTWGTARYEEFAFDSELSLFASVLNAAHAFFLKELVEMCIRLKLPPSPLMIFCCLHRHFRRFC